MSANVLRLVRGDGQKFGGGDNLGPTPDPFMLTCAVLLEALDRLPPGQIAVLARMLLAELGTDAAKIGTMEGARADWSGVLDCIAGFNGRPYSLSVTVNPQPADE